VSGARICVDTVYFCAYIHIQSLLRAVAQFLSSMMGEYKIMIASPSRMSNSVSGLLYR